MVTSWQQCGALAARCHVLRRRNWNIIVFALHTQCYLSVLLCPDFADSPAEGTSGADQGCGGESGERNSAEHNKICVGVESHAIIRREAAIEKFGKL